MNDELAPAAGQWVYLCRGCGYRAAGDKGTAEKARRIHRHRFEIHGRCGYQALLSSQHRKK